MHPQRSLSVSSAFIGALLFVIGCARPPTQEALPAAWPFPLDTPPVVAEHGMVACDAPLAAATGVDILKAGGNAIDAAVAAAFVLAVVYPEAGNIGGGGFLVARFADGRAATLDFREKAPRSATHDMYLDPQGYPTDQSTLGQRAAGVPGSVAGLYEAHRTYGSQPWEHLLAPAIDVAEKGFRINAEFAEKLREEAPRLAKFAGSRALFFRNGVPHTEGSHWRNPDLAATLRRIALRGAEGFYRDTTADLIVREMHRGGGLLTHEDLKRYTAVWRKPLQFTYRGHQIVSMPPPSSGGVTAALSLHILEGYDLATLGWHSAESLHLMAEAMRRAFAERNRYLGDPDVVPMPLQILLSHEYASLCRATINPRRATPSDSLKLPPLEERGHTTHLSVVDAEGNAVALTTTLNDLYGCAVTVEGAGFLLNNEMDDFSVKPGVPNSSEMIQGEANAIGPEKRMLSSMTPTIVLDSTGSILLVTGARGGPLIITSVVQVISNVIDYGMELPAAIHAPRIHHQHLPDLLRYEENGFREDDLDSLRARGHILKPQPSARAPTILRKGKGWIGAGDPRNNGVALGY